MAVLGYNVATHLDICVLLACRTLDRCTFGSIGSAIMLAIAVFSARRIRPPKAYHLFHKSNKSFHGYSRAVAHQMAQIVAMLCMLM